MVLKLVAIMPEAQMFFGAAKMILGAAADPVIIWMGSRTLPHYFSNYFQSLGEWFHSTPSLPLLPDSLDRLECQSLSGRENLVK
jgi:hypothetical protein